MLRKSLNFGRENMDEDENPYEWEKDLYEKVTKQKTQVKCDVIRTKDNLILELKIPWEALKKYLK